MLAFFQITGGKDTVSGKSFQVRRSDPNGACVPQAVGQKNRQGPKTTSNNLHSSCIGSKLGNLWVISGVEDRKKPEDLCEEEDCEERVVEYAPTRSSTAAKDKTVFLLRAAVFGEVAFSLLLAVFSSSCVVRTDKVVGELRRRDMSIQGMVGPKRCSIQACEPWTWNPRTSFVFGGFSSPSLEVVLLLVLMSASLPHLNLALMAGPRSPHF